MPTRLIKDKKTSSHNLGTLIMKITKSQLVQIIQEELKATLSESLAPYNGKEGYALDALAAMGGEQPLSDIAIQAWEAWSVSGEDAEMVGDENPDHSVSEEDWEASIREALQNLVNAGQVRLTQGGSDSSDERWYALA